MERLTSIYSHPEAPATLSCVQFTRFSNGWVLPSKPVLIAKEMGNPVLASNICFIVVKRGIGSLVSENGYIPRNDESFLF